MENKMEFKMDPINISDENELLGIVDDSSIASNDIGSHANNETFSLKQEDDVVSYRIIQIPDNKLPPLAPKVTSQIAPLPANNNTVTVQPCQFYLISSNDLVSTAASHTPVAPKSQSHSTGRTGISNSTNCGSCTTISKRRDEKRRATHNEVERRRRDKINNWIMKLATIIPEDIQILQPITATTTTATTMLTGCLTTNGSSSFSNNSNNSKAISSSDTQSKGGILSKACEYIPMLQDNIQSLNECLKDFETVKLENQKLRETNLRLSIENGRLSQLLLKHGLDMDIIEETTLSLSPSSSS